MAQIAPKPGNNPARLCAKPFSTTTNGRGETICRSLFGLPGDMQLVEVKRHNLRGWVEVCLNNGSLWVSVPAGFLRSLAEMEPEELRTLAEMAEQCSEKVVEKL
jgi:hypothetical protein